MPSAAIEAVGGSLTVAERRAKAWQLRKQGKSFPRIAKLLGISTHAAYDDIAATFRELDEFCRESAAAVRAIEDERLNRTYSKIAPLLDDENPLVRIKAATAIVALSARRAKLHGLDAPDVTLQISVATKVYELEPGEQPLQLPFSDPPADGLAESPGAEVSGPGVSHVPESEGVISEEGVGTAPAEKLA